MRRLYNGLRIGLGLKLVPLRLCQLDFDPELDFGENGIKAQCPRRLFEAFRRRFQPADRRGIEASIQQSELDAFQHIEGIAALPDRALAPLRRVLDALQRDQGIDRGNRP